MIKLRAAKLIVIGCLPFVTGVSYGQDGDRCLCIASDAVKKYCDREKVNAQKNEYRVDQETIARRDIQRLIDHGISADIAKDSAARAFIETPDLTVKELDGKVYSAAQIGAGVNNYQGNLRITDDTKIKIECLRLKGNEAIVFTNQHFVRYVPDRKDGSPHEVITNIIHREIWTHTDQGWRVRFIEELERGNTYLDGKIYNP